PSGGEISFEAFLKRAAQLANALTASGMAPGDRLAAQIEKSPKALMLYAACARAGIVFLPLNTGYTPQELAYFVENSGAKLLVGDAAKRDALERVAQENGAAFHTLNGDGSGSLSDLAARQPTAFETVARAPDDLAAFLYTSGTTGRSKGAMLSQANLISNAEVLAAYWAFSSADVLLHALPIFHTHGLFVATNIALIAGCPMIFLPRFEAGEVVRLLPRATTMMGVPTFYTRLLSEPGFTRDIAAAMRLFISGSAPLLEETHRAFEARTGHRILERYGMTETNMNTSNPYVGERRAGTVGFPLPGVELRIMEGEEEVAPGEIGVIEVRGPNVFQGYWQMPEKTKDELREDGFFITGDLGRVDEDGYVQIVGRGKDLIISGGLNIYPKEVELAIDALDEVLESAVIGVPHADFGEGVVAVVVPKDGKEVTPETVIGATSALARFKRPKAVHFLQSLPRNTMGKVQKNVLRERYAATFR
ncbi:MAG: malonyl-CoA synthase, partial [Pseudomonadota bacterium]